MRGPALQWLKVCSALKIGDLPLHNSNTQFDSRSHVSRPPWTIV